MCNVSRSDAADQALDAVVICGTKKVILSRYDEFRKKKGKIKNEAAAVYAKGCKLLDRQSPDKLRELARRYFMYAAVT